MPQLDQFMYVYASQLFWLGIVLAILYFGVGRAMLPKIEGTMDDRSARITADLAAAHEAQGRAAAIDEDWRKQSANAHTTAQTVMILAKERAADASRVAVEKTDTELNKQIAAADAKIAVAAQAAMHEIDGVAAEGAQQLVAKVASLSVSLDTARAAVKAVSAHD